MKIEIWSDIACPWCYIGKRRFETALADFEHRDEVEVDWRSYQLDPSLPDHSELSEAEYLSRSKGMPIDSVKQMFAHVTEQAAGEGLHYDFDSIVVANSFTAHRFLHFAKTRGLMSEAKEALLSGHFEHGRDIASHDYLVEVGTSIGLDTEATRRVLESEEFAAEVRADVDEARALGANGVPFFVVDRTYGISGAQSPAVFTQTLERAWTEAHPLQMVNGDGTEEYPEGAVCGPDGCH